jgi:hypothetical protein
LALWFYLLLVLLFSCLLVTWDVLNVAEGYINQFFRSRTVESNIYIPSSTPEGFFFEFFGSVAVGVLGVSTEAGLRVNHRLERGKNEKKQEMKQENQTVVCVFHKGLEDWVKSFIVHFVDICNGGYGMKMISGVWDEDDIGGIGCVWLGSFTSVVVVKVSFGGDQ